MKPSEVTSCPPTPTPRGKTTARTESKENSAAAQAPFKQCLRAGARLCHEGFLETEEFLACAGLGFISSSIPPLPESKCKGGTLKPDLPPGPWGRGCAGWFCCPLLLTGGIASRFIPWLLPRAFPGTLRDYPRLKPPFSTAKLLPSPVWPLPICFDSSTYHSRFLCNIALYNIGPCFYHQPHPQLGIVFALAPSFHSFWSYFSTDLR